MEQGRIESRTGRSSAFLEKGKQRDHEEDEEAHLRDGRRQPGEGPEAEYGGDDRHDQENTNA